jgi:hypothetical protein
MPLVPSKVSKRGDTGEAARMQLTDANGPIDLRGKPCRFLAKTTVSGVTTYIDSGAGDGVVIVEEDEPGGTVDDRGWVRFEPTAAGIDVAGLFECEVEVVLAAGPPLKVLTWPSEQQDNPGWQIDPDIPGQV